jgi:hypothetical protein
MYRQRTAIGSLHLVCKLPVSILLIRGVAIFVGGLAAIIVTIVLNRWLWMRDLAALTTRERITRAPVCCSLVVPGLFRLCLGERLRR